MSSLTVVWNRVFAVVGRVSMYRLVVLALAALAAIAFALSFFLACLSLLQVREDAGLAVALWIAVTAVQSDVLGYFVGKALGGPKFWPAISPNKTWSGTLAGWIGAVVLAVLFVAGGYGCG